MKKILMVGHRQGLLDAARNQGLDFLLWNDKELKNPLSSCPGPAIPGNGSS
jgi:hypothetical protein